MLFKIKERKEKKKLIRISLFSIGIILCISSIFITWPLILLGLYSISAIAIIKDLELTIYSDRFELIHKSYFDKLTVIEIFYYKDIKEFKFDKEFNNIIGAIFDPNNFYSNTTNSKPDSIEIKEQDGNWRTINKIGEKEEFYKAFEIILKQFNSKK